MWRKKERQVREVRLDNGDQASVSTKGGQRVGGGLLPSEACGDMGKHRKLLLIS